MFRTIRMAVLAGSLALLVLAAAPAGAFAAYPVASFTGDVSGTDGLPIEGALVDVDVLRGVTFRPVADFTTNDTGDVDVAVKAGSYRIDVSASGADPQTVYLDAEKAGVYEFEVTLQSYGSISGTVADNTTGLPVPGAMVSFYLQDADGTWPDVATATVAAIDGTYMAAGLAAGSYRVVANASGYASGFYDGIGLGTPTAVVVNRDSLVAGIDISLTAIAQSGLLSGRVVTGAAETPISNAFIFMYKQNGDGTWPPTSPGWGSPTRTVYTDVTGAYTSGELPLGNYMVRFFTVHTGDQWWQYVDGVDLATVLVLDTPGQTIQGIDGWFDKP